MASVRLRRLFSGVQGLLQSSSMVVEGEHLIQLPTVICLPSSSPANELTTFAQLDTGLNYTEPRCAGIVLGFCSLRP